MQIWFPVLTEMYVEVFTPNSITTLMKLCDVTLNFHASPTLSGSLIDGMIADPTNENHIAYSTKSTIPITDVSIVIKNMVNKNTDMSTIL